MNSENGSMKTKVFCIGFHKTGTTSLEVALKALGYRVTGPNGVGDENIKDNVLDMAYGLVNQFDAFQDNPWPIIYKQIDQRYPGSKFILTLRKTEDWISSQIRHFGCEVTPMRTWIYGVGCPQGNEEIYIKRFESHNQDVQSYFKGRPKDLLVLDLSKGQIWEHLCPFLGVDIPDISFPHMNKASDRDKQRSLKAKTLIKVKGLLKPAINYLFHGG